MWLDSRGRLLGRINLVDLLISLFLLSLGGVVAYAVGVSRYRALSIVSVEPRRMVAGVRQTLEVRGTGFDPAATVWLGPHISRAGGYWEDSVLGIEMGKDDVLPGVYTVRVRDGHGRTATAPDTLEIVWEPQITEVNPTIIYNTGPGARLDISGASFAPGCTVRLGEREIPAERINTDASRMLIADFSQGAPLPIGSHAVTVTNAGGQSFTWEGLVTVVPAPEVTGVAPDRVLLGDAVDLAFYGKNFRDGTTVWMGEEPIGQATLVSPDCLKIHLRADNSKFQGTSISFEPPDGPKTWVGKGIVSIVVSHPALMVASVLLDEQSARIVSELRASPEWRGRRPLTAEVRRNYIRKVRGMYGVLRGKYGVRALRRNHNLHMDPTYSERARTWPDTVEDVRPVIDVLVPARITMDEIKKEKLIFVAWSQPWEQGRRVFFKVYGQKLSGTVIARPFAIFPDDYFEGKKPQ